MFVESGLLHWLQKEGRKKSITVFEAGLGTGLNALLTAKTAAKNSINVVYYAVDLYPLPVEIYSRLNYAALLQEPELYKMIMQTGWEQLLFITPFFKLHKSKTDLLSYAFKTKADVIYFDAFAPEDQPEMWSDAIYNKMYEVLEPGGILVTYCSKSIVRKGLQQAGFVIEKLKGPPGKREIIRAVKNQGYQ